MKIKVQNLNWKGGFIGHHVFDIGALDFIWALNLDI
jgi:hypothetical protein